MQRPLALGATCAALLICPPAAAAPPLAPTPPMGWNSWNWHGKPAISESVVRETIDALVATGLRDAGYNYVVVDGGWRDTKLGPGGELRSHPQKFPSGMKALADYAHARGLKFGLHIVPGTHDCGGDPVGSLGREELHLKQLTEWGLDFVKIDRCKNQTTGRTEESGWTEEETRAVYTKWSQLIRSNRREMVFSISAYRFRDWLPALCHMARTSYDITARANGGAVFDDGRTDNRTGLYHSVMTVAELNNASAAQAGPGFWNDPDMLATGDQGLTAEEQKSHFALWCIMSSPLMLGNDPRHMSPAEAGLLLNREAISINQDPSEQGRRVSRQGDTEIWIKKLKGGRVAALLLNRHATKTRTVTFAPANLGLAPSWQARDVFGRTDLGAISGEFAKATPAHGCWLLLLSPR